jgi:hypothetical protein
MMRKKGWCKKLGGPDSEIKRKIFGLNSARLYGYEVEATYRQLTHDALALMKQRYQQAGAARSNRAYGFVAKPVG